MGSSKSRYNQNTRNSSCSSGACSPSYYGSCDNLCQMNQCGSPYGQYGPINSFAGYGYYTGTLVGYGYGF